MSQTHHVHWQDASVVITGAASGIGKALAEGMLKRGAHVCLADINGSVLELAEALGERASGVVLDVTDAEAFRRVVENVAEQHGKLDYLFNNAGIGFGADAASLSLEHYDRYIDINIRGVTNGVAVAYPLMVRQGFGSIVNTASCGGLIPSPIVSLYGMTKHAVVGLSVSLREEAKHKGVNIICLCPGSVDTPIFDAKCPEDLPPVKSSKLREYTAEKYLSMTPELFAEKALPRIEKNKRIIIYPTFFKWIVWICRVFPGLYLKMTAPNVKREMERLNR
jgi:NAD(P)-dependent dehydrogenase (short-subunit alcohol dehydrogenase family)